MVVRLIARVNLEDMKSTVLFPPDGGDEGRIALLTGIVQLISAALESAGGPHGSGSGTRFMKSERGVIAYQIVEPFLFIAEGDTENETSDAIQAVIKDPEISGKQLVERFSDEVERRAREIGDLWR